MRTIKILIGLIIVVTIVVYLYNIYYLQPRINDIKNNIQITNGIIVIVRIGHAAKGPKQCKIFYEYSVNGIRYSGDRSWSVHKRKLNREDLIGKHFPVAYSSKHYDVSDILIDYEDSLNYDLIK